VTERQTEANKGARHRGKNRFSDLHCDSVDFEFDVTFDKFRLDEFKKPFATKFCEPLTSTISVSAFLSTKDAKAFDYHGHCNWHVTKNRVHIRLGFYPGEVEAEEKEPEPFAETAMQWLGRFFKAESAQAHVHVAFEYDEQWRSLIPLPIKVPLGREGETEVDGMSLVLAKRPLGMAQSWIISREKKPRVLLYGDRNIQFDSFDLTKEIVTLSGLAESFVKRGAA
jgi:hypothetical protein